VGFGRKIAGSSDEKEVFGRSSWLKEVLSNSEMPPESVSDSGWRRLN